MRLIDATPLECQAKERKENEWNQRVSPTSWAHAEESFLHRIEDAPTVDAVVVTRCKDCEKSGVTEFGKRYCKEPMGCFFGCIPVEDDYFCSGGRRKDGGDG